CRRCGTARSWCRMTMRGRSIGSPTSAETIQVPASVAVRGIERGASRSPFRLWAVVAVLAATAGAPASAADLLAGQQKAESCGRCHGLDGNAPIPRSEEHTSGLHSPDPLV